MNSWKESKSMKKELQKWIIMFQATPNTVKETCLIGSGNILDLI